ncbi:uncharacterized protein LOC124816973 [Hydra vulgaris]|uniref:uncharacterized protein LOC124816970 n=1 Tax=Hydra vulgaris TaxID=6087 RepID=UPI001F5E952F|nr:uncharacterized protein LOC124816970 [Hydra vulgaris]XP_047142691.1 uncharacterized protein LOC124816973 [Hydra vulgaris]
MNMEDTTNTMPWETFFIRTLEDICLDITVSSKSSPEKSSTIIHRRTLFRSVKKNNHKATQVKMPVGVDECDDLQNIEIEQGNNNHTISQNVPEIEREFESFHAMPCVEENHKVDVLKWWKKHASTLPLLAQLATNLLCIPAASSCSERVFSASGGIINDKRHSLSTKKAKQLTLIKVNYDLVCPHMTLKIISDAEEALDPPALTPVRTPPKNPIPKAVF